MEEQKVGLAASRDRPIAKTSVQAAYGGLQFALDRQTYWFLSLQEALNRQKD